MKIVLAFDSFKGTFSAREMTEKVRKSITDQFPTVACCSCPLADGGEGTVEAIIEATGGQYEVVQVQAPDHQLIYACYGIFNETAIIEVAASSGMSLRGNQAHSIEYATTYGLGQLVQHAYKKGLRKFIIGLGGSATNDGGIGVAAALGYRFYTEDGKLLEPLANNLIHIHTIDAQGVEEELKQCEWLLASDVTNPLLGSLGATAIFSEQKGATPEQQIRLEQGMTNWANCVERFTGYSMHLAKGAGAAGGLGGFFQAFLGGTFRSGVEVVMEATAFHQHLATADLVITGEGKSDKQTLYGKVPYGVAKQASLNQLPTYLLAGTIEHTAYGQLANYFQRLESCTTYMGERALIEPQPAIDHIIYKWLKEEHGILERD